MVGRAKSKAAKTTEERREYDALMSRAVEVYRTELEKPINLRRGLRRVCKDFEDIFFQETGKHIHLVHSTLNKLADGGQTRSQASNKRAWLTPPEIEVVIAFAIETAARGWPDSPRRLKEHVDLILRARLGDLFPPLGVGRNWVARFQIRHSDRIKMTSSRPLEEKRGRGVNPATNASYWKLLLYTTEFLKINWKRFYGTDEVGVPNRGEERERVLAAPEQKGPQYQQRAGNRENTTVIVTICADGTALPPAVIFKGSAYQMNWGCDGNPLKASIGYQKKGWTDGEIGAVWIKIFDEQTRDNLEPGEYRLLLVDGHNSHYTVEFLLYAQEHNIAVLCYPSHATHIYQGLDVVIFSVLKRYLGEERDEEFRENGRAMDKSNFLTIYGRAHVRALTPKTIKAAFKATGVWPYNPDVVTPEMLAPSKTTSNKAHLPVPIIHPATDALVKLFQDLAQIKDDPIDESISHESNADKQRTEIFKTAVTKIKGTNLGYLMSDKPPTHYDTMPTTNALPIPLNAHLDVHDIIPQTENEVRLLAALRELEAENHYLRNRNLTLQSSNIFNELFCGRARNELQRQDEKKKKGRGMGKLTGLACLVTDAEFVDAVVAKKDEVRVAALEADGRKEAREAFVAAKNKWQKKDDERKEIKARVDEEFAEAKRLWDVKKLRATRRGAKFQVPQPKRGLVPKQDPKPKLKEFQASGSEVAEQSGSDEDEGGNEEDDSDEETSEDDE